MKKRVVSILVATIMTVMAGAFAPAVTAAMTISDSNVTVFTNKIDKAGSGTVTGVDGTEKTVGDYDCYSDYDVDMITQYAYINHTSIQEIRADNFGWAHFKFAISEAVNFVLQFDVYYTNTSNSRKTATLFSVNDSDKVQFAGTQQNPKDYTVDILLDLSGGKAYTYFNGIIKDEAFEAEISNISYLRQLRFVNAQGVAHNYKISGLLLETFPMGATLDDVLGYLTDSAAPIDYVKGTYFEGINTISGGDNIAQGSMYIKESSCSVTGDNAEGYIMTDTADSGYYRYFLFNNKDGNGEGMPNQADDSVVRHSVLITPKSGNKTISVGKYSSQEELVLLYFDENAAKIYDKNGNAVLGDYDNDTFYQVDFFFNNKDYEYRVYLDSKEVLSGTLDCTPVGYIAYENGTAGDSMILKNIFTKVYALGTSMNTVIGDLYGTAYIEIQDLTVLKNQDGDYEISAAAVFYNISKNYTNPKIIYALYRNSVLLNVGGSDFMEEISITNDEIGSNYSEINRKYPYGLMKTDGAAISTGDILTVKAWLIAGEDSSAHLIDSNEVSFTVE
ncbi:MAG: hypothetical protein K5768_07755 [Firmicutes bacterium]|nr:hypothetical protein [Bacillota bacterium]